MVAGAAMLSTALEINADSQISWIELYMNKVSKPIRGKIRDVIGKRKARREDLWDRVQTADFYRFAAMFDA